MAMLENVTDLTLERLNEITQAWVELDYHREIHSEIGTTPLRRYLECPHVGTGLPGQRLLATGLPPHGHSPSAPQ